MGIQSLMFLGLIWIVILAPFNVTCYESEYDAEALKNYPGLEAWKKNWERVRNAGVRNLSKQEYETLFKKFRIAAETYPITAYDRQNFNNLLKAYYLMKKANQLTEDDWNEDSEAINLDQHFKVTTVSTTPRIRTTKKSKSKRKNSSGKRRKNRYF